MIFFPARGKRTPLQPSRKERLFIVPVNFCVKVTEIEDRALMSSNASLYRFFSTAAPSAWLKKTCSRPLRWKKMNVAALWRNDLPSSSSRRLLLKGRVDLEESKPTFEKQYELNHRSLKPAKGEKLEQLGCARTPPTPPPTSSGKICVSVFSTSCWISVEEEEGGEERGNHISRLQVNLLSSRVIIFYTIVI